MKKLISFVLFVLLFSFQAYAQEKPLFDYEETKHELSLDIAPIIGGNYPSSLLYRQHYLSKKGNNVALRFGAGIGANISSTERDNDSPESVDRNNQNISVFVGKEWQKQIQSRIIGYYGADLDFGYSRHYFDASSPTTGRVFTTQSGQSFQAGIIGFLGMRYHFTKHFSVSAETAANLNYITSKDQGLFENNVNTTHKFNSISIGMIPLRAIRFALHF